VNKFCKLFDTERGQILVKMDGHYESGNPEVRFYAAPPGLGVCSIAAGYEDSDAGWDRAEAFFEKIDVARALSYTRPLFSEGWTT
jgi:hypothetical protein